MCSQRVELLNVRPDGASQLRWHGACFWLHVRIGGTLPNFLTASGMGALTCLQKTRDAGSCCIGRIVSFGDEMGRRTSPCVRQPLYLLKDRKVLSQLVGVCFCLPQPKALLTRTLNFWGGQTLSFSRRLLTICDAWIVPFNIPQLLMQCGIQGVH